MSDDLLSYQSSLGNQPTPMRTAAWISLLALGILYVLGGLCSTGALLFVSALVGAGRPTAPPNAGSIIIIVAIITFLLTVGTGVTYIWTAFLIRRFSRGAAIVSLIISALNCLGFLTILVLGIAGYLMSSRSRDPGGVVGILFYITPALANAWVVIALALLVRGKRA